jgi:hypothetical protein
LGENRVKEGTWTPAQFQSSSRVALITQGLLALAVLILSASAVVTGMSLSIVDRAESGEFITDTEITATFSRIETLGFLVIGLTVVTAIPFLVWQSRLIGNVPFLGGGVPRWSPTASVIWWFVPIVFWVMPYLVLREVRARLRGSIGPIGILELWWALWIAAELVNRFSAFQAWDTLDGIRTGLAASAIGDALLALAGILAIFMVRDLQSLADSRSAMRIDGQQVAFSGGQAAELRDLALSHRDGRLSEEEYEERKRDVLSRY